MDHFLGRSDNMVKLRGVNLYPMACLPAVRSDPRTTGEWLCEAHTVETGGSPRDEMIVHIEVRKDAAASTACRRSSPRVSNRISAYRSTSSWSSRDSSTP